MIGETNDYYIIDYILLLIVTTNMNCNSNHCPVRNDNESTSQLNRYRFDVEIIKLTLI